MKNDRKKAILDIVNHYEVDTQETLQALLLERGYSVTQATVSRDIKQLSLIKTMGENGSYKYSMPRGSYDGSARSGLMRFFSDAVYAVDRAMNIVVIRCHSGMANAVCPERRHLQAVGINRKILDPAAVAARDDSLVKRRENRIIAAFALYRHLKHHSLLDGVISAYELT